MKETVIVIEKQVKLKNPILIEGLPGLGLVGKIAAEHLLNELKAVKFATLYSPFFPPQVVINDDGTTRMMKNDFYYVKGKHDLIFIVGDHQGSTPESHYEICGKVLDLVEELGCKTVYTLGGYGTGLLSKKPKVFGAVTDKKMKKSLQSMGVSFEKTGGGIVGAAGLLIGQGKLRGMKGLCLMGETHGQIIDARSAKSVLEVLQKLLDVKIDLDDLEKRAKETEKVIAKAKKAEEQSFDLPTKEGPLYIR